MRQQADPDDGRGCWEVTGELAGLEGGKARSAWCSRSSGRNRAPPEALGWKSSVPGDVSGRVGTSYPPGMTVAPLLGC